MYPARIIPELQRQGWECHGLALVGSRAAESMAVAGVEPLSAPSGGRALLQVRHILGYITLHAIEVLHCQRSSDLRLGALVAALRPSLKLFFTAPMGIARPE